MNLEDTLRHLPERPGCYLMQDRAGKIIYIGKARNIRARVRSYFQAARNMTGKVLAMVNQVASIDYIATDSEVEALILESNLIKRHRPRYNIKLRDDKHYPYLKVTVHERWPRVVVARSIKKDGARYFGPYATSTAMWETLRLSRRIFPLRTCNNPEAHARPCLEYHIGRCLAPCKADFDRAAEYQQVVRDLCSFLEGRQDELVARLKARMEEAAEGLEFERAAEIRDQIRAVEKVGERQKIISAGLEDQDVIAAARLDDETCVMVFFVREGKVVGREPFFLSGADGASPQEVLEAFVKQFYAAAVLVPKEVLLPEPLPDAELIGQWLSAKRGGRVRLLRPQRGDRRRLVEMAAQNAALALADRKAAREREVEGSEAALEDLEAVLDLPRPPIRIECFDISNVAGQEIVGSMVVFEGGQPARSEYRRFHVRTVRGAPDDFASMAEVIRRRFRRGLNEREAAPAHPPQQAKARFAAFPDLLLIDGGKGQLSATRAVLAELGLESIPTFALAKENEWLLTAGRSEPIVLPRGSRSLLLLRRIRDEAHRFAVAFVHKVHGRAAVRSRLDGVPGVGPARRKALLRRFGSAAGVRAASVEEIAAVPGLSRALAERIKEHLEAR